MERVGVMRDLGVYLDEKLAFGVHVDVTVRKANRALGVLIDHSKLASVAGHSVSAM